MTLAFRRKWIIIGCAAAVLIGGGYWGIHSIRLAAESDRILKDPFSDHPLKYEKLGPSFYFRFSYRATFDNEPVTLDQLVECRPFLASGGIGGGAVVLYQRIPERAGVRLETGGVVYFQVPHYCRFSPRNKRWQEYWRPGESAEAIPLTYWANQEENPSIIEAYTVPAYFSHPDARLRLIESTVTFLPRDFEPNKKPEPQPQLKRLGGQGWFLLRMPAEVRKETLGEALARSTTGRFSAYQLTETAREQSQPSFSSLYDYLSDIAWGRPLNLPKALLIPSENEERIRGGLNVLAKTIPLSWDGQVYSLQYNRPPGLILLYTGKDGATVHRQVDRGDPVVTLEQERITLPTSSVSSSHTALCDNQLNVCYRFSLW